VATIVTLPSRPTSAHSLPKGVDVCALQTRDGWRAQRVEWFWSYSCGVEGWDCDYSWDCDVIWATRAGCEQAIVAKYGRVSR